MIGSGPNGLAAAITMARAGWEVTVHEAEETVGGGVRSAELTLPGFVHDVCSAIHPLGRDSPFFRDLELPVEWIQPPAEAAHPLDDGTAVMTERSYLETAERLGEDRAAYTAPLPPGRRRWRGSSRSVLGPHPPPPRALLAGLRIARERALERPLARRIGSARERPARSSPATPRTRCSRSRSGRAAESASSSSPPRTSTAGASRGAGRSGSPMRSPTGSASSAARSARAAGSTSCRKPTWCSPTSCRVSCYGSPATACRLATPTRCAGTATGPESSSSTGRSTGRSRGPRRSAGGPRPSISAGRFEELADSERAPWEGRHPDRPFVLLAQQSLFDDSRAPAGKHTAWAYCHVPNGSTEDMTDRIEAQVERFAPGFRELVLARAATGPADFERRNRNIVGGDINGGALDLGQLFFRPVRKARSLPHADQGPLPVLVRDTAGRRRPRHVWATQPPWWRCVITTVPGRTLDPSRGRPDRI